MAIKRIVTDIAADDVAGVAAFYKDLLGLEAVMDQGWIVTLASGTEGPIQLSIASEGGSGTEVPAMSIEVDDVDEVYGRAVSTGVEIVHPLTDEPWGVRRFFARDPAGKVINILTHPSGA